MDNRVEQLRFPPMPPDTLPLWVGALGPAAVWGLQLTSIYMLTPWACVHSRLWVLHLLEAVFLVTSVLCGLACIRYYRREESHQEEHDRTLFLASVGMLTSGMFSALIVAQGIATL